LKIEVYKGVRVFHKTKSYVEEGNKAQLNNVKTLPNTLLKKKCHGREKKRLLGGCKVRWTSYDG
jgi:hypothetical protein